jgi:16S rRNA (uracil1498-N3)-methyltransferase
MARLWRVHHPGGAQPGEAVELSADEAHYARRVLRVGPGDEVGLFDGRGGEWLARVAAAGAGGVRVVVDAPLLGAVEPPVAVELFQGLLRADRLEWLIQKATELGVHAIHLVPAERSDGSDPGPGRLDRWRRIALEGCRQSGRRWVPQVEPLASLPDATDPRTLAVIFDPSPGVAPLGERFPLASPERVWLAVGPESGFAEAEVGRAVERGWARASLGPRTLRAETAGVVAAALALHRWGDLGRPGSATASRPFG